MNRTPQRERSLLPRRERSPLYLEERSADNAITIRFASVLALVIDAATYGVQAGAAGSNSAQFISNTITFLVVASISVVYLVRAAVDSRRKRSGSHAFYALFWVVAVAAGASGWGTMLTGLEGFVAYAGALFGVAVLFRAHWSFFLGVFIGSLVVMIAIALSRLGIAATLPLAAYGFIWALVAFALTVKLEHDHQHLFFARRELAEKNEVLHEINVAHRYGKSLAVGLLDVDHFKRVNDELGHAIGDVVLKELATVMSAVLRDSDIVARCGGEEFVVIFAGCDLAVARMTSERLCRSIARHAFHDVPWSVTVSIGVTELRTEDREELLLKRVDELMYDVKRSGRNAVRAA